MSRNICIDKSYLDASIYFFSHLDKLIFMLSLTYLKKNNYLHIDIYLDEKLRILSIVISKTLLSCVFDFLFTIFCIE